MAQALTYIDGNGIMQLGVDPRFPYKNTYQVVNGTTDPSGGFSASPTPSDGSRNYIYVGALTANTALLVSDLVSASAIQFAGIQIGVATASATSFQVFDAATVGTAVSPIATFDVSAVNANGFVLPAPVNLQLGLVLKCNQAIAAGAVLVLGKITA